MNQCVKDQALAFITQWLEFQSRQMDVPGFVVTIQYRDEVLLSEAYGLADVERNEPLTVNHRFGVASISKMFTATAVMQLIEQGVLSLDDRAVRLVPWLAEHSDPRVQEIAIRHLLRHGGGLLRDGHNADFWQLKQPFPDKYDLRQEVFNARLVARPGGKLKYSNLGYALLGQIIERVSGRSYSQHVTEEIIKPLGLTQTTPAYMPGIDHYMATGYTRTFDRQRFPVPKAIHTQTFSPLFGWHTTARDLTKFMNAQFPGNDILLCTKAKAALHTGRRHHWVPPEDRGTDYGLGFNNYQLDTRRVTGHGGVYVGYRACAYADIAKKLSVVILANARDAPLIEMMQTIFSIFDYFERWGTKPVPPERTHLNTRLMCFWATTQIVATHTRIVAVLPEQWLPFADPEELEWINPTTLRITRSSDLASEGETVSFTLKNGNIVSTSYAGNTMLPENIYWEELKKGFIEINPFFKLA